MALKELLLRLFESHKKTPIPEKVEEPTTRLITIESLLILEPQMFHDYRAVNGGEIKFIPAYDNIVEYASMIRRFAQLVEHSRPIRGSSLKLFDKEKSVDDFLVDNEGKYVDNAASVIAFKSEALELCRVLGKCEGVVTGFDEHNLRILTNLLVNITETAEALHQVGQMN